MKTLMALLVLSLAAAPAGAQSQGPIDSILECMQRFAYALGECTHSPSYSACTATAEFAYRDCIESLGRRIDYDFGTPVGVYNRSVASPTARTVTIAVLPLGVSATVLLNGQVLVQNATSPQVVEAPLVAGTNVLELNGSQDGPDAFGELTGIHLTVIQ